MDFLNGFGWILFNVLVPFIAPVVLLPLLGLRRHAHTSVTQHIRNSVQDGQLFWTIIAMAASACYEAAVQISTAVATEAIKSLGWKSIIWHGLVIILSSAAVLLGVLDAENDEAKQATNVALAWPPIMLASLLAAVLTAVTFSLVHFRW